MSVAHVTATQLVDNAAGSRMAGRLMDAPLDELLAEYNIDVTTSSTTDPTFTGSTMVRSDGSILFAMRAGQPAPEREMVARAMLGRVLRVPLPDLPAPYQLTELSA